MLETETFTENCFENDIEINPDTIPENYGKKCRFCEKQIEKEVHVTKASNPKGDKYFAKTR